MHVRHCMLFKFERRKKCDEGSKSICLVYGDNAQTVRTLQNCFFRLKERSNSLHDNARPHVEKKSRNMIEDLG